MIAKVTIVDDGLPVSAYELRPVRESNNGVSTKYVFEFEYNKLNRDDVHKSNWEGFREEVAKLRQEYESINNPWGDRWDYTNPYDKVLKMIDDHIREGL